VDEATEIQPESFQSADATFDYTEDRVLAEVTNELGEPMPVAMVTDVQRRLEITIPEAAVTAYQGLGEPQADAPIPDRLQGLVIEHAYNAYAAGTGDNLGPCTVRHDNNAGNYVLSYAFTGSAQTASNLGSNWVLRTADTTNSYISLGEAGRYQSTNNLTSVAGNSNVILHEWLPGQEVGRYVQVRRGPVNGTPEPARGHGLYENFDSIMNGDPFLQLTERGRMQANGLPYNPQPALSLDRLRIINKKAEELLLQHLSEAQRRTWLAGAYFDLLAPSGRRYRLQKGHFHNVFLLDSHGNKTREYCAYADDPGGKLPAEDNVFAQMLTLMYDENEFLAHANTWDLSSGKKVFIGQGRDVYLSEVGAVAA